MTKHHYAETSNIDRLSHSAIAALLDNGPFVLPLGQISRTWEGPVIREATPDDAVLALFGSVALFNGHKTLLEDWRNYSIAPYLHVVQQKKTPTMFCVVLNDETGERRSLPYSYVTAINAQYDTTVSPVGLSFAEAVEHVFLNDPAIRKNHPDATPSSIMTLMMTNLIFSLEDEANYILKAPNRR
jgi:hypothetical protein